MELTHGGDRGGWVVVVAITIPANNSTKGQNQPSTRDPDGVSKRFSVIGPRGFFTPARAPPKGVEEALSGTRPCEALSKGSKYCA